jgi:hypothetical protein
MSDGLEIRAFLELDAFRFDLRADEQGSDANGRGISFSCLAY